MIMKVLALLFLEAGDAADVGDEYGTLLLLVLTLGFLIWQYVSLGRMEEREAVGAGGR